jgi:hypothetical protein
VSGVEERPSRKLWAERWAGSLSDIADIAREVLAAFVQAGVTPHFFEIEIETYEVGAERKLIYATVDSFLEGAPGVDLSMTHGASIWASIPRGPAPRDDQSISVHFASGYGGGAYIDVQAPGQHEQFVIAATERVNRALERGELRMPSIKRGVRFLSGGLALAAVAVLAFTDETTWGIAGLAMTVASSAVFRLERLSMRLFPPFELLPEGGITRARRVWNRSLAVAGELARPAYAAFLAAVFVLLLTRLFG